MIGLEAGIEEARVLQTPNEETGGGKEQQTECHLRHDERVAQPRAAAAGLSSLVLEKRDEIRAAGVDGRRETEDHRARERDDRREDRDAPIRVCGECDR